MKRSNALGSHKHRMQQQSRDSSSRLRSDEVRMKLELTCSGSAPRKCVRPLAWYGKPTLAGVIAN